MPRYNIVMLGATSPSADALRGVVTQMEGEFALVNSPSNLLLFEPDAIVIELEDATGLPTLTEIVQRRRDSRIPIIVIVPHDANGLLARALEDGADDFIFTPLHPIAARATIDGRCRLSLLEREGDVLDRATMPFNPDISGWIGLVNSAPNVILRTDTSGRIEFANRPIVEGLEPSGKHLSEVGLPELDEAFYERFHATIAECQPTFAHLSGTHPNLGSRDYTLYLGPILGGGKVTGVAVIIADVTEQRDAERALHENEQQLLTLVETAPDFIAVVDQEGVVRFLNRGADSPAEAFVGRPVSDWLEGGEDSEVARMFHKTFEDDDETHEFTFNIDDRWFEARSRQFRYDGEICALVFATDVTKKVQTEVALRETVQSVELLMQHLPLCIYELNDTAKDLTFRDVRASGTVAGIDVSTIDPVDVPELIHSDDLSRVLTGWAAFKSGEVDHWGHEFRIRGSAGQDCWVLGRAVRIADDRILGFSLDVTERKDLEAKLVHAGKMEAVGRLAGGVAHDFNNLLTSIVNFTWYVRDELPVESPLRADLGEVLKAADSGARLTSQLLAFSRRKPTEPTIVELNERLGQVQRVLERTIGENIKLEVVGSDVPLPVVVDPGQLDQLIFNLAVNARDAMPDGGTLRFTLSALGETGVMEVADSGEGIALDIQDRLFEPFFSTKGENGTGLGLATCYGIVRQAGGEIHVESEVGRGARFVIKLPLATVSEDSIDEDHGRIETRIGPRTTALVVEDQPAILKLVRRALEHAGWEVVTASTAEEALVTASTMAFSPGVLLTDVVLPAKSGVELAHELRERWQDLPVLLVSGYLGDEFEPAMATKGRTGFLPKPFNSVQLVSRLAVLLGD